MKINKTSKIFNSEDIFSWVNEKLDEYNTIRYKYKVSSHVFTEDYIKDWCECIISEKLTKHDFISWLNSLLKQSNIKEQLSV